MPAYGAQDKSGAFTRSFEVFASMVAELEDADSQVWTHARLEDHLTERSRELMRQLYQDRLDLHTLREQRRTDIVGADQVARTRVEHGHQRGLSTVFGKVTVTRIAYRAPKAVNLYPTDDILNLPEGKHSDGLAKLAVIESVRGSFDTTIQAITRATGVVLGKPQLLALVRQAATDVGDFYTSRRPDPSPDTDVLVMTNDGKGIRMRPDGLREITRKAAATTTNKLTTRLSPGEKSGRKRMAELGAVYDITPAPRTAADVIAHRPPRLAHHHQIAPEGEDPAHAVSGSPRRSPTTSPPWSRPPSPKRPAVTPTTAAPGSRWSTATTNKSRPSPPKPLSRGNVVTILIDFIHVLEYVWTAAWSFFDKGDPDVETWVADQATKILNGRSGDVAVGNPATRHPLRVLRHGTQRRRRRRNLPDQQEALPRLCHRSGSRLADRHRHHRRRLPTPRQRPLRHHRRPMGPRRSPTILTLRALTINGDLADYWTYHLLKEHHRRHETRYAHQQNDYCHTVWARGTPCDSLVALLGPIAQAVRALR